MRRRGRTSTSAISTRRRMTDLAAPSGGGRATAVSAREYLPVVVKASVGSGGQQVRAVHTQSEFDKAVAELTTGAGDPR